MEHDKRGALAAPVASKSSHSMLLSRICYFDMGFHEVKLSCLGTLRRNSGMAHLFALRRIKQYDQCVAIFTECLAYWDLQRAHIER